jgi:arginine:agmatine antiporter
VASLADLSQQMRPAAKHTMALIHQGRANQYMDYLNFLASDPAVASAPFADVLAPILGASVAGAIAICAVLKASGTLGATLLLTAETAESDSVLAHWHRGPPPTKATRVSTVNLLLTGVITSLVVMASASPTLTRQFTIVTNVSVVLSLLVYGAACLVLLLRGLALPAQQRFWAIALGGSGAVFSGWLIYVSETDLLIWTACTIAIALALYAAIHVGRKRAPLAV